MRVGLNAGFGESLASEMHGIAAHGFTLVRQDVYAKWCHQYRPDHNGECLNCDEWADAHDGSVMQSLVAEFVGAPLTPLFLIGGGKIQIADGSRRIEPHELAAMTRTLVETAQEVGLTEYAIEIGNEPDIAHEGYSERPQDFAEAIRQCHEAARGAGFTGAIISGGISNLNDRGLGYLDRFWNKADAPNDLVIGFHRYPEEGRGPLAAHDRFTSREDEWNALRDIVDDMPLACTEFGYHTACARPLTLTDSDVAACVCWDLSFYQARGVSLACVYQLNDGPTENYIDKYGIRRTDRTWKPVAEAIAAVYGECTP